MEQAGDVALEKEKAMIEAVRSIPGVTAVGTVSRTPMTGGMHGIPIFPPGTTEFKLNNSVLAPYVFHDVAGIPGGCRHSAAGRAGCLMAGHQQRRPMLRS